MDAQTKADILQRVREDRIKRNGVPYISEDLIRRSVIASMLIEGIDCKHLKV